MQVARARPVGGRRRPVIKSPGGDGPVTASGRWGAAGSPARLPRKLEGIEAARKAERRHVPRFFVKHRSTDWMIMPRSLGQTSYAGNFNKRLPAEIYPNISQIKRRFRCARTRPNGSPTTSSDGLTFPAFTTAFWIFVSVKLWERAANGAEQSRGCGEVVRRVRIENGKVLKVNSKILSRALFRWNNRR